MASKEFDGLVSLLEPSEIINQNSPHYGIESQVWAHQKFLKPKVVIRPCSIESLSKTVAYLNKSTLKFGVRSRGYGSSSARDVLISLTAFDDFEFDRENEVVTLGAGQPWRDYYEKMEKIAPDYQVVAIRTPAVGVGGSILCGGYSWMGREYGCTSDPNNCLDMQVVKLDGSIVWASSEPDLLWALRGSSGGFGIVTKFKLKAYKYPQDIFCGPIIVPRDSIKEVATGIAFATSRKSDPKLSMFLYVMPPELLGAESTADNIMVIHAYDALGEEHGRSEAGFKWALDLPGAKDMTGVMNLRAVAKLQDNIGDSVGKSVFHANPVVLTQPITEDMVNKCMKWYDQISGLGPSFRQYSMFLAELMCIREPVGCASTDVPWPRPANVSHILMLGSGYSPDQAGEKTEEAMRILLDAPKNLLPEGYTLGHTAPYYTEHFTEVPEMFGENYARLQSVKRKYDPHNRLQGLVKA